LIAASPKKSGPTDRVVPASQLHFTEQQPGITKAMVWGDAKGPYGAITRFRKGTKVPWHTHSYDIKAVVISGTLIYDSGNGEQRLGPGSFLQELRPSNTRRRQRLIPTSNSTRREAVRSTSR
jgi:hypothetical protein